MRECDERSPAADFDCKRTAVQRSLFTPHGAHGNDDANRVPVDCLKFQKYQKYRNNGRFRVRVADFKVRSQCPPTSTVSPAMRYVRYVFPPSPFALAPSEPTIPRGSMGKIQRMEHHKRLKPHKRYKQERRRHNSRKRSLAYRERKRCARILTHVYSNDYDPPLSNTPLSNASFTHTVPGTLLPGLEPGLAPELEPAGDLEQDVIPSFSCALGSSDTLPAFPAFPAFPLDDINTFILNDADHTDHLVHGSVQHSGEGASAKRHGHRRIRRDNALRQLESSPGFLHCLKRQRSSRRNSRD